MRANPFKADAKAKGLLRFFDGKPCKHGHVCERYTNDSGCVECKRLFLCSGGRQAWMRDYNKTEKGRSFHATYWTSAKFRETRKRWEAANREQQNLYHNALAKTPKGRARLNSRKSRFKQATPPWVDRAALRAIYAACPPGYEVDHAVPLQGALVSGLHVPWNLQYLLMSDNRRKSNQHDYEVVADDH